MRHHLLLLFLLLSLASASSACAPPQATTPRAPEPARSVYEFPAREALSGVAVRPKPTLFEGATASDAAWEIVGELPGAEALGPHSEGSYAADAIVELARSRADWKATDAMECFTRESALFQATHGAQIEVGRRRFVASRCGATPATIGLAALTWEQIPEDVELEALLAHIDPEVRTFVAELPGRVGAREGAVELGAHFARSGERAVFLTAWSRPKARLASVRPQPDEMGRVVLRGQALEPIELVGAVINQGPFGAVECEVRVGVALPRFEIACPMASGDAEAAINVYGLRPGRYLLSSLAELLARRPGADLRGDPRPQRGGEPAADPNALATELIGIVNEARSEAGLPPLRHAAAQTTDLIGAAPHYFMATEENVADADQLALAAIAGWRVEGMIREGRFASVQAPGTHDTPSLVAQALASPVTRRTLLDPETRVLAVGGVVEEGGLAAMFVGFRLFDASFDGAAAASRFLERIATQRASLGLEAPTEITDDPGLAQEIARVHLEGKDPHAALDAAMSRAAQGWRRDVQGYVFETASVERFDVPAPFLQPGPLMLQAAVSYRRAPGGAWGQHVVGVLIAR